jgi:hypothetical protein
MLSWGNGSALGVLACLGYSVFALGAFYLWRYRSELTFWFDREISLFRRNLSRYVPAGPFYLRRGESRLRVIPVSFFHSVTQLPRRRFSLGAFLLFLGLALFLLDFFV